MSLNVTIPDTFNGPLGLLHSLILRDEIDIYDIPIARLTNSYLEEIKKLDIINVDEGAEFLDLASRLLEIKLRMLVPPEEGELEDAEEDDDFDPRGSLVEALLEYRRFKDAARLLGELAEEQARRFPRVAPRIEFRLVGEDNPDGVDCLDLLAAFQSMLDKLSVPDVITTEEVPISGRIEQLQSVRMEKGRARFSFLLAGIPNRQEMAGFFIAVLELIRQCRITARQTDDFSDIIIEPREPAEPARETALVLRVRSVPSFPLAFGGAVRLHGGGPRRSPAPVVPFAAVPGRPAGCPGRKHRRPAPPRFSLALQGMAGRRRS
ncbi:MAG: segregation/condensation protein A [Planctomycetes bacterium]|nr:segregation/condensation protein A [Planctomycetota bacterium]